ncbi:MAG TPA: DUF4301 family protein [Thermoanaerobaculia bacterium]|nr:DUF4301 family protein [Thermoanaerobaculia bacterium]
MPESLFTDRDLRQMDAMGLAPEEAVRQVELFRNPPPHTRVLRPCQLGDGIQTVSPAEHGPLLERFDAAARRGRIGKFVPASGAATRMFKDLLAFLAAPADAEPPPAVRTCFDNLHRLAFRDDLAAALAKGGVRADEHRGVFACLLGEPGLSYAELPKGLLPFHLYPEGPRTPFEEHLVEAAAVARAEDGRCLLHFTVSPEHQAAFERRLDRVRPAYEERFGCRFDVSFSTQRHSTDTLAVDLENRPFRLTDGSLLFRPGGHGALLENLNALGKAGWDLVLLKNIDNVVPDARKPLVHLWKRALGGCLLTVRDKVFDYLNRLQSPDATVINEAAAFLKTELSRPLPESFASSDPEGQCRFLIGALDRPLRVCGVVRNQGEPGGGPFWVESPSGEISLQIVEISQIDSKDPGQQGALAASTHFNPVDIVCGLHDRHGRPYDLHRFVDPTTVFIAEKSHEGRALKALERPGLWNGAMAGWNTVFVEVPDATFAPVKTVLDLLRPEHQ